jgi:membrane protease YdiL (CAAX protease family)
MERLLARLDLGVPAVLALATLTAAAEEILFRGALLDAFGLWPQAILFGLLHPASRRGWSYPVFAFASGVGLGWLALYTGTLWAPLAAHFAINLQGLLAGRSAGRRNRRTRSAPER